MSNIREEIKSLAQPLDQFNTHPKNVRQGDVGAITTSLEQHGQYRPIVVQQSTGNILAGNHTYLAAKSLGWKEIAATYVDCDDEQAVRILLVDNRANDLAMYDDTALASVLEELAATDTGLEGSLFSGDDLDDLLFRLEGTIGNAGDGKKFHELTEGYLGSNTKALVLPLTIDEFEEITQQLATLRKFLKVETNSDVFKTMVEEFYARTDTK